MKYRSIKKFADYIERYEIKYRIIKEQKKLAKQVTKERILDKLPVGLGNIFTQEKYFCVMNMEV